MSKKNISIHAKQKKIYIDYIVFEHMLYGF